MIELFQMWALVEVLGLVCLPLTVTVFHNLPDRGWAFSKTLGLAIFAFSCWFPLMLFQTLPFSQLFIDVVAVLLFICGSAFFLATRRTIGKVVRGNIPYIIVTELVFLGMVFLLGWLRSFRPDIRAFEMFMDEGFIASIMRSPHLPPNDMWFAGYSINYYYYAHYAIALLAKFIGQAPSIAFNTGIAIYFGLAASNLYGVTCNIVAWARYLRGEKQQQKPVAHMGPLTNGHMTQRQDSTDSSDIPDRDISTLSTPSAAVEDECAWDEYTPSDLPQKAASTVFPSLSGAIPYGLITMVMGLILGNLYATQLWWENHGSLAPYDWFNASRKIDSTINEFPAFSFLLSCFHAHVLALAFTIMAMGLALNLLLETDGKGLYAFGRGWQIPCTLLATALTIGGLFVMNGWDYPTYMGMALACIALQQWLSYERRISFSLVVDIGSPVIALVALSFILYLPFYLNFVSPSQGFGLVNPKLRSSLSDELLIFGFFAFLFISLLIASAWRSPLFERVQDTQIGSVKFLRNVLIGLGVLAVLDLVLLFVMPNSVTFVVMSTIALFALVLLFYHVYDRAHAFTLLLGALAFALIAGCEIFYLRDLFGDNLERMNTVFKFYFQAWALLAVAGGTGLFFLLERFWVAEGQSRSVIWTQRVVEMLWAAFAMVLLLASMVYPLVAPSARLARFDPKFGMPILTRTNSLDGLSYLQNCRPPEQDNDPFPFCKYDATGDYYAIRWLNAHIQGDPVIVESMSEDYSLYGRISAFTGLPTIMGWGGHEVQWRIGWISQNVPDNRNNFNNRFTDLDTIYKSPDPQAVLATMKKYQAQYLYVGMLEHIKYPQTDLSHFGSFMRIAYQDHGVTIYKVN